MLSILRRWGLRRGIASSSTESWLLFVGVDDCKFAQQVMQGFGLGIRLGMTYDDLRQLVGIHPTVAEELTVLEITKRYEQLICKDDDTGARRPSGAPKCSLDRLSCSRKFPRKFGTLHPDERACVFSVTYRHTDLARDQKSPMFRVTISSVFHLVAAVNRLFPCMLL